MHSLGHGDIDMTDNLKNKCTICGEPMPENETMFKYHGLSGPCPKPPLNTPAPVTDAPSLKISHPDRLKINSTLWGELKKLENSGAEISAYKCDIDATPSPAPVTDEVMREICSVCCGRGRVRDEDNLTSVIVACPECRGTGYERAAISAPNREKELLECVEKIEQYGFQCEVGPISLCKELS